MNSSYYHGQVAKLEKEVAELYKKIADEQKRENDKNRQVDSTQRSITKNTSITTLQSKQRQIQGYQNDILSCKKKIADYQKQIASKTSDIGKKKQEARKAEESEAKKAAKEQQDLHRKLQASIDSQRRTLDELVRQQYAPPVTRLSNDLPDSKEYDFFISHAFEDKEDIVRNLANSLKDSGFEVWYDEFELKIGDSLRKKIDHGLARSKFGVVIISPSFVKKNWPEYELNGMVAREMNGQKVILPIWHKISKDEVLQYSPTLADKLALNTTIHTLDEIVRELAGLISN